MGEILITLLILLAASSAAICSGLINSSKLEGVARRFKLRGLAYLSKLAGLAHCVKSKDLVDEFRQADSLADLASRISRDAEPVSGDELYAPIDMSILNCRIRKTELKEGNTVIDTFGVEICGSIHAPIEIPNATLKISILDITDGTDQAKTVQARSPQGALPGESNGSAFYHVAKLGRLPQKTTTLQEWTSVAGLRTDGQEFPRSGRRTLRFDMSIASADDSEELANAWCTFVYDNPAPGYIDLQENDERTKVLAVALAFTVSAASGKPCECEVELIKDWARENVLERSESASYEESCRNLEKALGTTIAFFSAGNKLDTYRVCEEIVGIATLAQRYEILELCLHVAQATGSVAAEEMAMLRNLATCLEVDAERFRAMVEKILPVSMHEVMNIDDLLGITSDMSKEHARKHLNREYSKWNSRVTSNSPEIQNQADQMLKLIAEARGQYVADRPARKAGAAGN
ncbi:MAG: TerB family tellurite resistance protein [Planctomycetota bacterium]|jgi:tellurite resistance protein